MTKKIIKKAIPIKKEPAVIAPVKIPVNLDEIKSIHTELVKYIPGGGDVETRHLLAARLWAVIEGLK